MNNSQHPFGRRSIAQAVNAYDAACVKCVGQRGVEITDSANVAALVTLSRCGCVSGVPTMDYVDYGDAPEYVVTGLAKSEPLGRGNIRFFWAQRRSGLMVVTHTEVWHVLDVLAVEQEVYAAAQAALIDDPLPFLCDVVPLKGGH